MALLGISEAARLIGRDVSTLHRAMKSGRLSYTLDAAGKRQVDPAEIERVFGNGGGAALQRIESQATDLERIIMAQGATIERQDATIRDLRSRLDREAEERRQLIALLTDRRPWWRRWFR